MPVTREQDYAEWAQRMASSFDPDMELEGVIAAGNRSSWRSFVGDKLLREKGFSATQGQLDALEQGRDIAFGAMPRQLGATFASASELGQSTGRYRDSRSGRFISGKVINEFNVLHRSGISFERSGRLGKSLVTSPGRFRSRATGRFVSRSTISFNLSNAGL